MAKPRTLFDKIWDAHLIHQAEDGTSLIYIDRHLVHEVTSPQAFEGLRNASRPVREPARTSATASVRAGSLTGREAFRNPSNACGLVTS